MKLEDYKSLAGKLTDDNATAVITDMLNAIESDLAELDGAKTTLAENASKIKDLQDTNMKLFLTVTGNGGNDSHEEEEEKTPDDYRRELTQLINKED